MSEDIGSLIDQARKAGHSDKQIYEHLSTSVNPEYQKFARKNAQQFGATAPSPTIGDMATDAWDLANQPFGATGITPLNVAEAGLVPATGYGAYKYAKSQKAKSDTPALSDEDVAHQRLVKQEELRSLKLNNDLLERKLNPPAQPTSTVQPTPQAVTPVQPTVQVPVPEVTVPSFGKGTDMPLNPMGSPISPEVKALAPVMDAKTTALAEVATGKIPKAVGPPPELVGPVKPPSQLPEGIRTPVLEAINDFATKHPEVHNDLLAKGKVFVPGPMAGDNRAFNAWGKEGRHEIMNIFNEGKPIGIDQNLTKLLNVDGASIPSNQVPSLLDKMGPPTEKAVTGIHGSMGTPAIVTPEGKILTSNLTKKVLAGTGIGGMLMTFASVSNAKSINAARNAAGESALSMIPGVGASAALYHSPLGSGTLHGSDQQLQIERDLLSRPDVRSDLSEAQKQLSPIDFKKFRTDYLSRKIDTEQERLNKNTIKYGTKAPFNTGMGVPPP